MAGFSSVAPAQLTAEQKDRFKALMRARSHAAITPEIRRELFQSRNRGDPFLPSMAGGDAMEQ